MSRSLKHLPLDDWPAEDRSLFECAFRSATDPFDDDAGPGGHLRPRTQGAIVFAYRRWLGWLTVDQPETLMLDPPDRVTRERIRSYASALAATMGPIAVAMHIARLYDAIRYMAPERDWIWLKEIKTRLTGNAKPAPRRALPFDSMALQDIGLQLMKEAEAKLASLHPEDKCQARAVAELHRDGLIIAIAALFPLRRRNLCDLVIDSSLYQVDQLWAVDIANAQSKNDQTIKAVLPASISEHIERYFRSFRVMFPGSTNHRNLWCSWYRGAALTEGGLYLAIRKRVGRKTGHWISLHDFRRIAATSIAIYRSMQRRFSLAAPWSYDRTGDEHSLQSGERVHGLAPNGWPHRTGAQGAPALDWLTHEISGRC